MFAKAIARVKQSIFPIFFERKQGNQITVGVSGTAFFIDNRGLFLTANHVIAGVPANSRLLYVGNVPHRIFQPIELVEVLRDAGRDIFIGRIQSNYFPRVKFARKKPRLGASICLCGYPMARITLNPNRSINVSQVRQYWQPTYVIDYFRGTINNVQYDGFMTQHTSLRGMSGGPVFDVKGVVYGMDVATSSRNIPNPNATSITVNNGIAVGMTELYEFISQAKSRL